MLRIFVIARLSRITSSGCAPSNEGERPVGLVDVPRGGLNSQLGSETVRSLHGGFVPPAGVYEQRIGVEVLRHRSVLSVQ
jgi:hypothetical protein